MHSQFVHCQAALEVDSNPFILRNLLFCDIQTNFLSAGRGGATIRGEQAAFHRIDRLYNDPDVLLALTNCLLVSVTNAGSYAGVCNSAGADDGGDVFVQSGAGNGAPWALAAWPSWEVCAGWPRPSLSFRFTEFAAFDAALPGVGGGMLARWRDWRWVWVWRWV